MFMVRRVLGKHIDRIYIHVIPKTVLDMWSLFCWVSDQVGCDQAPKNDSHYGSPPRSNDHVRHEIRKR